MARPQSEARLGFYPFPPPCLPLLARHLRCREPTSATILDPCAGEGDALAHLAAHLGVPAPGVYAVELDAGRARTLHERLDGAHVLAPCSFAGTRISGESFSLVYVNPPYAGEMGGGRREELTFLVRALNLLAPGGVLAAVFPQPTVFDRGGQAQDLRRTLACRLSGASCWALPAEHRENRELVILGVKRAHALPGGDGIFATDRWWELAERPGTLGAGDRAYDVPAAPGPKVWLKSDLTPAEVVARVKASPLNRLLDPPRPARRPRPPGPLSRGHIALGLASGLLDGLVEPEGEPPHVVRGTDRKVTFLDVAKSETTVDEEGRISEKSVYSEKPVLTIRTLDALGTLRTLTDRAEGDADVPPTT